MLFFEALSIFGISFLMSLTSSLLNRKLVDREKFAKYQEEISRYNSDRDQAKKTKDKKLYAKLKKQEKTIAQMQSKMLKGQLLTLVINLGIFFAIWQVLIYYFQDRIVAYVPFAIPFVAGPAPLSLPFFYWYIVCSFFSSMVIQRIFGVGMGMTMQPPTTQ